MATTPRPAKPSTGLYAARERAREAVLMSRLRSALEALARLAAVPPSKAQGGSR